jgi:hypothetical protein
MRSGCNRSGRLRPHPLFRRDSKFFRARHKNNIALEIVIVLDLPGVAGYRTDVATFSRGQGRRRTQDGAQIVSKRIIAAISQNPSDPVYYFAGYHDQGETSECRWTLSRDHARWFDADEAELEALMLTPDYVDYRLLPEPLST